MFSFSQSQVLPLVDVSYVDYQNVFVGFLFLFLIQFVNASHNPDHENWAPLIDIRERIMRGNCQTVFEKREEFVRVRCLGLRLP